MRTFYSFAGLSLVALLFSACVEINITSTNGQPGDEEALYQAGGGSSSSAQSSSISLSEEEDPIDEGVEAEAEVEFGTGTLLIDDE